jgi:hypothetical protein
MQNIESDNKKTRFDNNYTISLHERNQRCNFPKTRNNILPGSPTLDPSIFSSKY